MKKLLLIAFTKSDKNFSRLSSLVLCLIMSMNLSGQNIKTILIETWSGSSWLKSFLSTYTYDGSDHLTNVLSQTWDVPTVSWVNGSQSNYTNNPDGTANVVNNQSWDGSQWNDFTRTTYTYNGSKKVLTATSEIWLGVFWQNGLLQTNTYDGSGFLINTLSQTWPISAWQNNSRIKYTNNLNGTVHIDTTQIWDGVSTWKNSERSTFTYNGANKVLTDLTDTLDNGNWVAYLKETNLYDGSGYLTNSLNQQWDKGSTSYKNESQSNYTNNGDGTPSVVINQLWDNGPSAWINDQRITFTYSSPTRIPELRNEESLTIYPNPAGDVVTIKGNISIYGTTYSITDQSGKLVLKGRLINGNSAIDISTLANGIYFLNFGEGRQRTYKVIKNK